MLLLVPNVNGLPLAQRNTGQQPTDTGNTTGQQTTDTAPTLEAVSKTNRAVRNSIVHWTTLEAIKNSVFGYGMTDNPIAFSKLVDCDTGEAPIQHDFVTQLGARLEANGQKVRFMEIGVS